MNQPVQDKSSVEAGIARETWDGLARKNAMHFIASNRPLWTQEEFFETGRQAACRLLQKARPRTGPGTSMCDVGCGIGRLAFAFSPHFDRIIGIDVSPEMIDRAVSIQDEHDITNTQFLVGNGADLREIPDGSQDLVVSHLVFLHLTSRVLIAHYLQEFSRVLKRGAPAFFDLSVVPAGIKNKVLFGTKEVRDHLYRSIYRFYGPSVGTRSPAVRGKRVTLEWLKTELKKAGLELVDIALPDNWADSALTSVICRKV